MEYNYAGRKGGTSRICAYGTPSFTGDSAAISSRIVGKGNASLHTADLCGSQSNRRVVYRKGGGKQKVFMGSDHRNILFCNKGFYMEIQTAVIACLLCLAGGLVGGMLS